MATVMTRPVCSVDECTQPHQARGMCKWHYERWRKCETVCSVGDCGKPQFASGWCQVHYWRMLRHGDVQARPKQKHGPVCSVDGCEGSTDRSARGMCNTHYLAWYRETQPVPPSTADHRRYTRKYILKQYGLTQEDYDRMLAEQGGCCAICGKDDPGRGHKSFIVDHDHETGRVRGLLCHLCNIGLGSLGDSLDGLCRAAEYLLAHAGGGDA